MTREEWIQEVKNLLLKLEQSSAALSEESYSNYQTLAESLAETYYDEDPNDFSPRDAVYEELFYVD